MIINLTVVSDVPELTVSYNFFIILIYDIIWILKNDSVELRHEGIRMSVTQNTKKVKTSNVYECLIPIYDEKLNSYFMNY